MKKIVGVANDLRWISALVAALLLVLGLQMRAVVEKRARTVEAERSIEELTLEMRALERTLAEERASRDLAAARRGRGPGGIASRWDSLLFDGPTAAQSALEFALAVNETDYRHLRYEGRAVTTVSRFPSDGGDDADMESGEKPLPVRGRYAFHEWPIQVYVESDYASLLKLIGGLTSSQPAFSIRDWHFETIRDEQGRVVDRLGLRGELATFWLTREG